MPGNVVTGFKIRSAANMRKFVAHGNCSADTEV
jgi:hypothetical protein